MAEIKIQLPHVDGVMIGRAAYQNPYQLAEADRMIFNDNSGPPSRDEILDKFRGYVKQQLSLGVPLNAMTRHILGLYQGQPGARTFRRQISEHAHKPGAGIEVLQRTTDLMSTVV